VHELLDDALRVAVIAVAAIAIITLLTRIDDAVAAEFTFAESRTAVPRTGVAVITLFITIDPPIPAEIFAMAGSSASVII